MKTFPSDQRLKLLVGRIEDAKKAEISDRISSLIDQAKERENALDILAATDLWAQVLQATPDNAEIQKKFCAAAYRIALVYEGELPESDKVNASRYLELIQKLVKKESASDYDTAMKLLDTLKK